MRNEDARPHKHPDKSTHRPESILDHYGTETRIIAATASLLEHADDQEARFRIRDGAQLAIARQEGA